MKRLFILCLIIGSLSSCAPSFYYQVYNVESDNVMKTEKDFIYKDEYCNVKYDLWAEGGELNFMFTNKTDTDICLDMERSCFIKDGLAYNYSNENTDYLNIESNSSVSTHLISAKTSTTFVSKEIPTKIWIPANSSRIISGFNISNLTYLECDKFDLNFPKKTSETIRYDVNNTPLTIRNRIVYHFANDEKDRIVENKFWIIDYTNYREKEMFEREENYNCLSGITTKLQVFKHQKTYRFYNKYKFIYNEGYNKQVW